MNKPIRSFAGPDNRTGTQRLNLEISVHVDNPNTGVSPRALKRALGVAHGPKPPKPPSQAALHRALLGFQQEKHPELDRIKERTRWRGNPSKRWLAALLGIGLAATLVPVLNGLTKAVLLGGCCLAILAAIKMSRARAKRHPVAEAGHLAESLSRIVLTGGPENVSTRKALESLKSGLFRVLELFAEAVENGDIDSVDAFFVRQAVLTYVPEAVGMFQAIPESHRFRPANSAGRSPAQALEEQFADLLVRTGEIEANIVAARSRRLEAHARFLRDKVGN